MSVSVLAELLVKSFKNNNFVSVCVYVFLCTNAGIPVPGNVWMSEHNL